MGFGTVGSSVARILVESAPAGLELTHIVNRNVDRKRVDWVPKSVNWVEDAKALLAAEDGPDVFVELAGGLDPAGELVRTALNAGKSVVTANKKLIAFQGLESGAAGCIEGRASALRRGGGRRNSCHSGSGAWACRRPRRAH